MTSNILVEPSKCNTTLLLVLTDNGMMLDKPSIVRNVSC